MYPEYAEICGKRYKINTDYRVALRCFDVINDQSIGDCERSLAIIYLLFGIVPDEHADKFLEKASYFLQCGKEQESSQKERDIDFNLDSGYIMASFMSDYHIDISKMDMHFWQYIDLIQGLTKNCVLSRVRELRNYDLSEIKDPKQRNEMATAKKAVELPIKLTAEEQKAVDEFEKLFEMG